MNSLLHVSSRQHAGLILMAELAKAEPLAFVSLGEIAKSMSLSQGYLEEIAASLRAASLIEGRKGPAGGYRLTRSADQISMNDVALALEGPVQAVPCHGDTCPVSAHCSSKHWWDFLRDHVSDALKTTTLQDVITQKS